MSGYTEPAVENGTAAFVLSASPDDEVAGTSLDPLCRLSDRELVRFVLQRTTELRDLTGVDRLGDRREIGARNVTVLGSSSRLVGDAGSAGVDDRRAEVVVTVDVVEHGGDVVVALGLHDTAVDERATQAAPIEQIEHDGRARRVRRRR